MNIGGCDAVELAQKYGTPLYVLDEANVREKCRGYRDEFNRSYGDSLIIFASKALCTRAVLRIISQEGLGADVSSGGELFTALKAGMDPKKIYFHGNNKSAKEIEEGLKARVGRFVIDNFNEIGMLSKQCADKKIKQDVMIRINPGVEAHTHDAVKTGQTDSKFGIPRAEVPDAVKAIVDSGVLTLVGLHAHIGSQIFDAGGYMSEIDVLVEMAKALKDKFNIGIQELNIGGGLGIKYVEGDDPMELGLFASSVSKKVKDSFNKAKLAMPKLILEPGRSIVGSAGVTLYTVGHIKEIKGTRKYLIVDGGMADNPRPMLYGSKYQFVSPSDVNAKRTEKYTIAGRFCESGDVLAKDVMLPKMAAGDILAVMCTGAYNYSMSSNYNRVPRPAMVMVKDGKSKVIIKRESYEGMTSCDAD